jgi:hypothetical protein
MSQVPEPSSTRVLAAGAGSLRAGTHDLSRHDGCCDPRQVVEPASRLLPLRHHAGLDVHFAAAASRYRALTSDGKPFPDLSSGSHGAGPVTSRNCRSILHLPNR